MSCEREPPCSGGGCSHNMQILTLMAWEELAVHLARGGGPGADPAQSPAAGARAPRELQGRSKERGGLGAGDPGQSSTLPPPRPPPADGPCLPELLTFTTPSGGMEGGPRWAPPGRECGGGGLPPHCSWNRSSTGSLSSRTRGKTTRGSGLTTQQSETGVWGSGRGWRT